MWLPSIQSHLSREDGRSIAVMQVGLPGARQDKLLFFAFAPRAARPSYVCRASRAPEGQAALRREAAAREAAYARLPEPVRRGMPWCKLAELAAGPCVVEPYVPGEPLAAPETLEAIEAYGARTLGWLAAFRRATTATAAPDALPRRALEAIAAPHAIAAEPAVAAFQARLASAAGALAGLAPSAVHGDFWRGNLRLDGEALGVFDWEWAEAAGNPWFDPALNLLTLAKELPGGDAAGWLGRCLLGPSPHARLFGRLLDAHGLPAEARPACAVTFGLVLLALVQRDYRTTGPLETPNHALLRRFAAEPEPFEALQAALWPAA